MPREVRSKEEFIRLSEKAVECIVVKNTDRGIAKIKLRTPRYLYTIKISLSELDGFLKNLKTQNIKTIE